MVRKTTKTSVVDEKGSENINKEPDISSFVGEKTAAEEVKPFVEERPPLDPVGYTMAENNYPFERNIPDANLPTEYIEGVLDIANEGSGLLRPSFSSSNRDIYISSSQIRRFNLRVGDMVGGQAPTPKEK